MANVSISELKANLSRYLREVRRGGEIQVLDRGVPVARLVPLSSVSEEEDDITRQRLIKAGVLKAGQGSSKSMLREPPLDLPTSISDALAEERRDRL